jgi:hypothetical protein
MSRTPDSPWLQWGNPDRKAHLAAMSDDDLAALFADLEEVRTTDAHAQQLWVLANMEWKRRTPYAVDKPTPLNERTDEALAAMLAELARGGHYPANSLLAKRIAEEQDRRYRAHRRHREDLHNAYARAIMEAGTLAVAVERVEQIKAEEPRITVPALLRRLKAEAAEAKAAEQAARAARDEDRS